MAGVLPEAGVRGGGLLSQFEQRRPRLAGFLGDHSSALMQFGLGLLSGRNRADAWGNASQGLAYGQQSDQARRERTQEEEERARQDEAINNLLMSPEFQSLPAEYRTLLTNDRELARAFIANDLTRRTTPAATPVWETITDANGLTAQRNIQTGEVNYAPDYAQPGASAPDRPTPYTDIGKVNSDLAAGLIAPDAAAAEIARLSQPEPGYHIMTPEELDANFIPRPAPGETPYQMGPNNQITRIGGGGVTINNGTVDERRYNLLYRTAVDELPVLEETFGALGEVGNQAADALPGAIGNFLVSEDYQRAKYAAIAVIQAQTYAMTGAAAPESEAERLASLMLPRAGDGPTVIAEKLERIRRAVANLGGYADLTSPSPGGVNNPRSGEVDLRRVGPADMPAGAFDQRFNPDQSGWVDLGNGIRYRVNP